MFVTYVIASVVVTWAQIRSWNSTNCDIFVQFLYNFDAVICSQLLEGKVLTVCLDKISLVLLEGQWYTGVFRLDRWWNVPTRTKINNHHRFYDDGGPICILHLNLLVIFVRSQRDFTGIRNGNNITQGSDLRFCACWCEVIWGGVRLWEVPGGYSRGSRVLVEWV